MCEPVELAVQQHVDSTLAGRILLDREADPASVRLALLVPHLTGRQKQIKFLQKMKQWFLRKKEVPVVFNNFLMCLWQEKVFRFVDRCSESLINCTQTAIRTS